jgi:hypothetical protein
MLIKKKVTLGEKNNLSSHELPALCAHDGFAWIVNTMRKEASQAALLAGKEDEDAAEGQRATSKGAVSLAPLLGNPSRRAYLKSLELYAEDSRLSVDDEVEIMGPMRALMSLLPVLTKHEDVLDWKGVRAVAVPVHNQQPASNSPDLANLLLNKNTVSLRGMAGMRWEHRPMSEWHQMLISSKEQESGRAPWLANVWLDLYNAALDCVSDGERVLEKQSYLAFLLAFLAQQDPAKADYLVQLTTVAMRADRFQEIRPPTHRTYSRPGEGGFDVFLAQETIKGFTDAPTGKNAAKPDAETTKSILSIAAAAQKAYAEGKVLNRQDCDKKGVQNSGQCCASLMELFARWRKAGELHDFVRQVSEVLSTIECTHASHWTQLKVPEEAALRPSMFRLSFSRPEKVELTQDDQAAWTQGRYDKGRMLADADAPAARLSKRSELELPIVGGKEGKEVYARLLQPLRECWALSSSTEKKNLDVPDIGKRVQSYLEAARSDTEAVERRIRKALAPQDEAGNALEASGLWPAPVPTVFLAGLRSQNSCSEAWRTAIGAFALRLRHQQRGRRCLRFLHRKDIPGLEQELKNPGSEGWAPKQHPEWLLLEVDGDVCIRSHQAAVAEQIMSDEHGNRLLQLLMGAGKTAIIIPMVIASLADGQRCLRVTVIGPLYATNAADWQLKLGGLLGKRVYPFICRREFKIEQYSEELLAMLQGICQRGHVIVTIPEHRLSLENKALELAASGDNALSASLHRVLQFFSSRGRDVLDESDEILHPKFQLIYSLGQPLDLDGDSMRWIVGAAVLHSVVKNAGTVRSEFGAVAIELRDRRADEGDQHYPSIRLLERAKDGAYARLCELIAEDFLAGVHPEVPVLLRPSEAELWRRAVLDKEAPDTAWQPFDSGMKKLVLLLRGFLAHGVLFGSLHKRWRVEYGGHPSGLRRMAVPYRAKDVAAEKTEFGHPDVALLLTTLHYYNAGLSREQLEKVFSRLATKGATEAQATYGAWAQNAPLLTVRSWTGVNLEDTEQFITSVYPALNRHMQVVDFWLDQVAFPIEARQFGTKLVSNAWDLCRSDTPCITTGFSGTDDARLLLPLTIQQENMGELMEINSVLLHNLLRAENDRYTPLEVGATGQQLLEIVCADSRIDVLLDAGALVLEFTHRQVAQLWLKRREDRKAAVYFEGNRVDVVDRFGRSMPFAVSPFENAMEDCLLYLDDEHCRGSDFRVPKGRRALVTLGKGMQKDKLLQAVMRMRQLGNGHTVSFMASFEAELQISAWRKESASFKAAHKLENLPAILSWCLSNTVSSTCDRLIYLAAQGAVQLRKRHAYTHLMEQPQKMAEACAVTEVMSLEDLYGYTSKLESVPDIVTNHLVGIIGHLDGQMSTSMTKMAAMTMAHIRSHAGDVLRYTGLFEEEHERELEEEMEEEVELVDRPQVVSPFEPMLSDGVMEFLSSGREPQQPFPLLNSALAETSFAGIIDGVWDECARVTPDFIRTVQGNILKDSFLRPVTWTLSAKDGGLTVLISNFEAEQLAGRLLDRKGKVNLNMFTPLVRLEQAPVLPSLPNHGEAPISVHVFAGSIHGTDQYLSEVRSFLGLCTRQPGSATWREMFEQRAIIESDGFVLPDFRGEVAEQLGVQIESSFTKSPVGLLRMIYSARHLGQDLQASPVGQLLAASGIGGETRRSVRSSRSMRNSVGAATAPRSLPTKAGATAKR